MGHIVHRKLLHPHPTNTMDFKQTILSELEILRSVSVLEASGTFKERAYNTAIKAIQALPRVLSLEDLPPKGLTKEMRSKVSVIFTTGRLEISEGVRSTATALSALQGVYGIGPKKAQTLIQAGFPTIESLRAAAPTNPKLLNKNQRIGLLYYEQLLQRIPRAEMDEHATLLMSAKPPSLEGVIVGSYRRGMPNSGDIDMLLRTADSAVNAGKALDEFVAGLKTRGYLLEVLAHGEHKCMGISRIGEVGRRLDLLITPPDEFPFAVFYFTGCDTFNVAVRAHAQTMGYTLNEHALTDVKTGAPVLGLKSEEEIFAFLKLRWVLPKERIGPDAVVGV